MTDEQIDMNDGWYRAKLALNQHFLGKELLSRDDPLAAMTCYRDTHTSTWVEPEPSKALEWVPGLGRVA